MAFGTPTLWLVSFFQGHRVFPAPQLPFPSESRGGEGEHTNSKAPTTTQNTACPSHRPGACPFRPEATPFFLPGTVTPDVPVRGPPLGPVLQTAPPGSRWLSFLPYSPCAPSATATQTPQKQDRTERVAFTSFYTSTSGGAALTSALRPRVTKADILEGGGSVGGLGWSSPMETKKAVRHLRGPLDAGCHRRHTSHTHSSPFL